MSGASLLLMVNLAMSGLLAAAFAGIAAYDRRAEGPRWIAGCYLLGAAYLSAEASIPYMSDARPAVVLAFALFLLATMALNVGLSRVYRVRSPWWQMAVLFVVSVVAVWLVQDLPRRSALRMFTYQLPYAAMQFAAMATILSSTRGLRPLDRVLAAILAVNAVQFLSKPLIALALGSGAAPQDYLASPYATVSQGAGNVLAIATALSIMAVLARDILAEMQARSETDMLSGLLNRRGFEAGAADALDAAEARGLPVCLVIADIDRFKAVNDTYGHAAGDRVITAFASFLREAAGGRHVAGRIGGEEFAVLLPGTNVVSARLFAEGARNAFSAMHMEGFPGDQVFTASFGVAERSPGESIGDLLVRADVALYVAKSSGRDCVRVAPGIPPGPSDAGGRPAFNLA